MRYTIHFNREEYGYINIEAETEEEATEMFEEGNYDGKDENIKNGQTEIDRIEITN